MSEHSEMVMAAVLGVIKDLEERNLVHVKGKTMVVFGTR